MKNSQNKKEENVNPEELLKDAEKLFKFIDKFEALDLEKANLNKLQNEINKIQKTFKDKYSDYIDDENLSEEDLDTKE